MHRPGAIPPGALSRRVVASDDWQRTVAAPGLSETTDHLTARRAPDLDLQKRAHAPTPGSSGALGLIAAEGAANASAAKSRQDGA